MSRWEVVKGTIALTAGLAVIAGPILAAVFVWHVPQRVAHALSCNYGNAGTPTWSPDGRWIAFADTGRCDTRIVAIHPDGSGFRVVTNASSFWPSWTKQGEILVNAPDGFSVVRADGGTPRVLVSGGSDEGAALSPDGRKIAFTEASLPAFGLGSNDEVYSAKLFVADRHGAARRLVAGNACAPGAPTWSPDGVWLVFGCENGVVLYNSKTRDRRRILRWPFGEEPPLVSWSPNGRALAFVDYNSNGLYVLTPSGRDVRRIAWVNTGGYTDSASWSPDGRWLAYSANNGAKRDGIYVVRSDGTHNRRVARV